MENRPTARKHCVDQVAVWRLYRATGKGSTFFLRMPAARLTWINAASGMA
jgi:hypothetical protein